MEPQVLQETITKLLPGLVIDQVVRASGQRVVYFAHFQAPASDLFISWNKVVIKVTEELDPRQIAYLQKEIDILNQLNSSCYPRLHHHEAFTHHPDTEAPLNHRIFVTIEERIDAKPLSDCKDSYSDEKAVADLLLQLIDGLSLLWKHKDKLIHRDIKPDNILIRASGEVVIIDLGILREEGALGLTAHDAPWGPCTPAYASPEQARNEKDLINFKSDFFALGILSYELLSGANPFYTSDCHSREDILSNVIQRELPRCSRKNAKEFEMSIKLYHQCGHNTSWNVASHTEDSCGDGLILSPVHRKKSEIENMDANLKARSIFDPQYYLPNSQKLKIKTYPFFPEIIADGFATQDFSLVALDSARGCIAFQVEQGFEKVVIPARYFEQMDPKYTEKQSSFTLHPFLKAAQEVKLNKPLIMTLPLTAHMIKSPEYRVKILNWITKYPEISGVYLFASSENDELKQIQSEPFLSSYLDFLKEIRDADLEVIIGYCNTEGLLYSMIEGCDITFGTFENTRSFSIDKFVINEDEKRGPAPRIYLPGLLNWVRFSQAVIIKRDAPELWKKAYIPTTYGDTKLEAAVEPHFSQPELYRHHCVTYANQVKELALLTPIQRYETLRAWIKNAMELNEAIADIPFDLEKHGRGDHLQAWLDAANSFYKRHLKSS
jgi:serine/threonine protein kinase